MTGVRRKYDAEFREGAVRIVREARKPIAQVAEDLGPSPGDDGQLGEDGPRRAGRPRASPPMSGPGWSSRSGRTTSNISRFVEPLSRAGTLSPSSHPAHPRSAGMP